MRGGEACAGANGAARGDRDHGEARVMRSGEACVGANGAARGHRDHREARVMRGGEAYAGANGATRGDVVGGESGGVRLVVGAGCSLGCPADELAALVDRALRELDGAVVAIASVDRRASEPCITALAARFGVPLRTYAADALAEVDVPTPSATVAAHVGTKSVAEAAALLATRGELVVPKRRSPHATCAIAEVPR